MADWGNIFSTGKGSAYVWQGNAGLDYLRQQDFLEKKQRQKQLDDLNNDFAKININGAKREDIPVLMDEYNNLKRTLSEIEATTDRKKKVELQMKFKDQKMGILNNLYNSKEEVKAEGELYKIGLTKPDDVSDNFYNDLKTWRSLSTFDPKKRELGDKLVQTMYRPQFDDLGFTKKIAPMVTESVTGKIVGDRVGNATVYSRQDGEKINPEKLQKIIIGEATADRNFKKYIQSRYPQLPIDQAIDVYAGEKFEELSSMTKTTDKQIRTQEDETLTPYQRERLAIERAKMNGAGGAYDSPQDLPLYYGREKDNGGKKAVTTAKDAVKLYVPTQNFQGSEAYDADMGEMVKITDPSNKYSVVSLGNYPVVKADVKLSNGKVLKKGSIVQDGYAKKNPNSVEYQPKILVRDDTDGRDNTLLLDYKYMPKTLTKKQQEIASGFKPASPSAKQPAKAKTISKKNDPLGLF